MKTKSILPLITFCLLIFAVFACASGGGGGNADTSPTKQAKSGTVAQTKELPHIEADIEVFPQLGPTSGVSYLAFSPDGKRIFSGGGGYMKLWDTETGREIRTLGHDRPGGNAYDISPDGKQYLCGDYSRFLLYDMETGKIIRRFDVTGGVYSVSFSPDGRRVLSGLSDTIILWDVETGREIRTFSGHTRQVYSISFSPDGKQILSGSWDNTVKLWDTETGREIRTFSGHTDRVRSIAFSPDRRQVISSSNDKTIKLWDVASGKEVRTFSGHPGQVWYIAFSPNGRQILSSGGFISDTIAEQMMSRGGIDDSGFDRTVKLWDTETGREIRTFSDHGHYVTFSPDGSQFLFTFSGAIKLWDVETDQEIRTFAGHSKRVRSVNFSPDRKQVLSGYNDGTIKLWDIATGREINTFSGHSEQVMSVNFSPDGKHVFSYSDKNHSLITFKIWDIVEGQEIKSWVARRSGTTTTDGVKHSSVSFSLDRKQVLLTYKSRDGTFKLLDTEKGREIRTFSGHTNFVSSVCFSPDGKRILSGSNDGTLKLWDVETGREIRTFTGYEKGVELASFSPNGTQILFASSTVVPTVIILDVATGREILSFRIWEFIHSLSFSPDGRQILSGGNRIKLWNAATGNEIRTFTGHGTTVPSVCFSPDGKQILSGSEDTTTRLWDVATGKEIAQFISFSGSDTQLASATRGLTVETKTAAASNEGEWLSITPDGYYTASPRGDRYLNVRVNNTVSGIDSYRSIFYNPDVVQARLAGRPDPASKASVTIQQAANFIPPTVTIQSPANFSTTNTGAANLSVAVTDQNQPIKNVKVFVNGRSIGRNELARTVTGNQKTANFTLPLELDPGANRIEVVAFNGYSDTRRHVDVTWNAPASQRPALPNLWILAVGVNGYDNAGPRLGGLTNLGFCVADAKGLIDSLKAQEGKRYAKVNALLIADGESTVPTAANIRQNLKFLDQAGDRDVVLLFLAGHGISAQEGKFFFLPKDAVFSGDKTVDASRAISGDELVAVLEGTGNRLLFIDACQSGGVDNDRMVRAMMESNAFVFAASQGYELSYEDPRWGHGAFTYSILNALKGAPAALAEGNVSVRSMSGFVSIEVPRITGNRQNPKVHSLLYCDFPMAVISGNR